MGRRGTGVDPKVLGARVDCLHLSLKEVGRMGVGTGGAESGVAESVEAPRALVVLLDTPPSLTAV